MLKRSHYITLVLVLGFTLIILGLPHQTALRIKLALGSLFLPLFGLANASHQLANKAGETTTSRAQLLKENDELHKEQQQSRVEAMQAAETAKENARLRQLLGWQQKIPWKLKLANVVLRDPANWWRTIQIDLGTRDGIRPNMPVLTPEGLVGRISAASFTRSQVVLIGDPDCKVAAQVENERRDEGVIESAGLFDSSLLTLGYLPKDASIKPGQDVVTSGLGGIFPKGIPLGKVVDSHPVEYGLSTEARVKLSANLGALEEVWVLIQ